MTHWLRYLCACVLKSAIYFEMNPEILWFDGWVEGRQNG